METMKASIMKKAILMCSAFVCVSAEADTYTVYAEDVDGMTPVQQLTNAVAKVQDGDLILIEPGTYTFPDDVYMDDNLVSDASDGAYCKFRLSLTNGNVTIRGNVDTGRRSWTEGSEPVIIDGNGAKAIQVQIASSKSARIENIAFVNCDGGSNTSASVYGNKCRGGAIGIGRIKYGSYQGSPSVVISNCVFRGNSSAMGGAIGSNSTNFKVQDCYFTGNSSEGGGGCIFSGSATGCDFVGNDSVGLEMYEVKDCRFFFNKSSVYNILKATTSVSDSLFVANTNGSFASVVYSPLTVNCHFTNNVAVTTGKGAIYADGGVVSNCTVHGNCAGNQGAIIINPTRVENCRVTGNSGYHGGGLSIVSAGTNCRVVNSYFGGNNGGNGAGAAKLAADLSSLTADELSEPIITFDKCTFETNYVGSGNHGGAILNAASNLPDGVPLESLIVCSNDCLFAGNQATHACGVEGVTAVGCRFVDNFLSSAYYYLGGDAALSRLVDCEITGGNLYKCSVDRCWIHNVTNACCVFNNLCYATNTLVAGCVLASENNAVIGRYYYAERSDTPSEFVNCTFVANRADMFAQTNRIMSVNCAYFDNTNRAGTATAIYYYPSGTANNGETVFENCAFGSIDSAALPLYGENLVSDVEPRFAAQREGCEDFAYYMPVSSSPLCGAGQVLGFTASDKDLSGRPRLRDGRIDIGCYQCWNIRPGFVLMVR